ncbi:MAG: ankyrin repeat domain-containing protein [Planctomycetota bacterium]
MKAVLCCFIVPVLILVLSMQLAFASHFEELESKARKGDLEAMYELGTMYEKGVGVTQNYIEAHKWYNIAAYCGSIKASEAREAINKKMIAQDLAEARKRASQLKIPDSKVSEGWFPLMFASFGGHKEIVETLIKTGADINMKINDGSTALMGASMQGHYSIVKFLLEKGADKTIKNNYGLTALALARQGGYDEIVDLLIINLRSSYSELGYNQANAMLKKYNFFDQHSNKTGDFINDYHLKTIKGHNIVQDYNTNLMWHQSGSISNMKWEEANKWVDDLNKRGYAGYNDWRLPTLEEAASLLESSENNDNLYIEPVFNSTQSLIWTGDSFGSRGAWNVNFGTGGVIWRFTNLKLYVRPVRNANIN